MKDKRLNEIGKWLNEEGYNIDLKDPFWMEEYLKDEKFRDICELLENFSLGIHSGYNEQAMREAFNRLKKEINAIFDRYGVVEGDRSVLRNKIKALGMIQQRLST